MAPRRSTVALQVLEHVLQAAVPTLLVHSAGLLVDEPLVDEHDLGGVATVVELDRDERLLVRGALPGPGVDEPRGGRDLAKLTAEVEDRTVRRLHRDAV